MKEWLFHQHGFTRTSLAATVTRVSNFVEENVCLFVFLGSLSQCIQSLIVQQHEHVKCVNRNALGIFKALNKSFK